MLEMPPTCEDAVVRQNIEESRSISAGQILPQMLGRICASELEVKGRRVKLSGGAPGWGAECLSLSEAPDAEMKF